MRCEIERALEIEVALVPVLVGGALMPSAAQLPESIAALARRQAFSSSDQHWRRDIDELVQQLQLLAPALRPRHAALPPVSKPAPRPGYRPSPGNSLAVPLARWLVGRLGKLFGAVLSLAVFTSSFGRSAAPRPTTCSTITQRTTTHSLTAKIISRLQHVSHQPC